MEHSVVIDRPPADVFRYLTDVEKLPEWQASAIAVSAEGEMRVGTRLRETRNFIGRQAESMLEVTEYEPDRKFSLRVLSGPLPFEVRHTLTPEDGGTRLDWVGEAPGGRNRGTTVQGRLRTAQAPPRGRRGRVGRAYLSLALKRYSRFSSMGVAPPHE